MLKKMNNRAWGNTETLHKYNEYIEIKDISILPRTSTTFHWHENFNELVFVREGTLTIYTSSNPDKRNLIKTTVERFNSHTNQAGTWHSLCNETYYPLKLTVILHGSDLSGKFIKRLD